MKPALATATFLGLLTLAGCSSSNQTQNVKPKPGEKDPNTQHLEGTTDVLKNYRLPETGKKPAGFQDKKEHTKSQHKEPTPQK